MTCERNMARPPAAGGLPDELLVAIFEYATDNPTRVIQELFELHPFDALREKDAKLQGKDVLPTKFSLFSSCRRFRTLMVNILYEDIWIHHGSHGLLYALKASSEIFPGYGSFAKRITMPAIAFEMSSEDCAELTENASRIISYCPNIRVLSRSWQSWRTVDEENGARLHSASLSLPLPAFPSLTRVDWDNAACTHLSALDASPPFLWNLASLEVLTLGGNCFPTVESGSGDSGAGSLRQTLVDLPSVHTLRLHSEYVFGHPEGRQFSLRLPSLTRVVLEKPSALFLLERNGCLSHYSPQITSIELGPDITFLHADYIAAILRHYCPNVTELVFPVFSTCSMIKNFASVLEAEHVFYKVKHVSLHASLETELDRSGSRYWWLLTQINDHFDVLCGEGTCFTSLERITLYGSEWVQFVGAEEFRPVLDMMSTRKIELVCEDGYLASLLSAINHL